MASQGAQCQERAAGADLPMARRRCEELSWHQLLSPIEHLHQETYFIIILVHGFMLMTVRETFTLYHHHGALLAENMPVDIKKGK